MWGRRGVEERKCERQVQISMIVCEDALGSRLDTEQEHVRPPDLVQEGSTRHPVPT